MDTDLRLISILNPISLSVSLTLSPLSTASMTLPPDADIQVGQFAELFTLQGSAGIFRVEQVECSCQQTVRVSLTHTLITLADSLLPDGEENAVTLPAAQFFRDILAQQQRWVPGRIDLPEDQLITWQGRSASLLEALQALLEALPTHRLSFDQSVFPWVINLLSLPQEGLSECRLTRNLRSLTIETDRSQLCTQLYLSGMAEPLLADTAAQWGMVARRMEGSDDLPRDEWLLRGQQYLEQHKNPAVTIQMEAFELGQLTGSSLDSFRLGTPCRVCLPESHVSLTHRIVTLAWPDVYATPELLRITLANQAQNTASLLAGLIVDTTQVKRQVTRQWNTLGEHKSLLIAADESIALMSQSIDLHAKDILTLQSGVSDNAAQITLNKDSITSKVSKNGVISAINQTAESVRISASRIDLDGYVTMSKMEADFAALLDGFALEFSTTDLYASTITLGQSLSAPEGVLSANTIAASASMTVDGAEVATQSWADSRYYTRTYCNANYATFTHLSTNYALKSALSDYQLASGLTTQTITVVKSISKSTATTPPFYNEAGTKVNNGVDYVKSISCETATHTVVVYA